MALTKEEREAMKAIREALEEVDGKAAVKARTAAGKNVSQDFFSRPDVRATETRPVNNTGPDLVGQMRDLAAQGTKAHYEEIREPASAFEAGRAQARGHGIAERFADQQNLPRVEEGRQAQTARDAATEFGTFGAAMLAPGAIAAGAGKLATGAVARSAARAPGSVKTAVGDIGRSATGNLPAQAALDYLANQVGVPHGTVTALKTLPSVGRAAGVMADEGVAAIGRAAGIKPWSPVNYTKPPITLPDRFSGLNRPELNSMGPDSVAGGVPHPVSPEFTVPIPRVSSSELAAAKPMGGVDVAAQQARNAGMPDDSALLTKTQRLPSPQKTGPSLEDQLRASLKPAKTDIAPAEKPALSPKMQAYRDRLKDAEDTKFAKGMGMGVEDYRALMARRATRVQSSMQSYQQTGNQEALQKDLTDHIFGDGP